MQVARIYYHVEASEQEGVSAGSKCLERLWAVKGSRPHRELVLSAVVQLSPL